MGPCTMVNIVKIEFMAKASIHGAQGRSIRALGIKDLRKGLDDGRVESRVIPMLESG